MNNKTNVIRKSLLLIIVILALSGCGRGVSIQSGPLAGPNAASIATPQFRFASLVDQLSSGLMSILVGTKEALAAVSTFTSFKLCNDTLVLVDMNGNTVQVNGSANQAGFGLLNFSPSGTSPMTLGTFSIPGNTQVKEIDITSAVNGSMCQGASYAVSFDPGSGPINITQNTAFKFKYANPITIKDGDTLTVLFGQIVNGMVALGAGLNNTSIQTVNVGVAQ